METLMRISTGVVTSFLIIFLLWMILSPTLDDVVLRVMASLLFSSILTAWIFVFFLLWDSDSDTYRLLALVWSGLLGGPILLIARDGFHRVIKQ